MKKFIAFFAVFFLVGTAGMLLDNDIVFAAAPIAAICVGVVLWMREGRQRDE